uniref:Uncharacterized protein n=1 Tax=Cucumis melo TaxID=3656 RepID=A0A9I9ELZ9_CUCME
MSKQMILPKTRQEKIRIFFRVQLLVSGGTKRNRGEERKPTKVRLPCKDIKEINPTYNDNCVKKGSSLGIKIVEYSVAL